MAPALGLAEGAGGSSSASCPARASGSSAVGKAANLFEALGRPRHVLAPMVDQSELPFRLLARRYGAQLCYTPMINAGQFVRSAAQRAELLAEACPEDRPLVAQFAGHDGETLLRAARYVEHMCDAVDLNLGCPQGIARRGRYGAYLLEEEDLVVELVRTLSSNLSVPVTCKIRLFRGDLPRTLKLCKRLEEAGCALLTVHGRNRYQNKQTTGECDWSAIAAVKAAVNIPVVANGGVATHADLARCLEATGADGVMTSEAALENPAIFCGNRDAEGAHVDQDRLAREYLELATAHFQGGPGSVGSAAKDGSCPKCVKAHLFKLLYMGLQDNTDLRDRVGQATSLEEYWAVSRELSERGWLQPMHGHENRYRHERSWYFRHRLEKAEVSGEGRQREDDGDQEEEDEEPCWAAGLFDEE